MRSIKFGLLGCAIASLVGAFTGCSADGATEDGLEPVQNGSPNQAGGGAVLPPSNPDNDTDDDTTDGGKPKDAGKDAKAPAKDAGPPPDEGSPCTTPNAVVKRSCGTCGMQEAICIADADAGGATLSKYGDCKNQVENGCTPGATEDIACGNCGTQKRTCNNYCKWGATTCTGEPTNSCTPGNTAFIGAGCTGAEYRQKSCQNDCTWTNVSATCSLPPKFVVVPETVGSVTSTIAVLSSTQTNTRMPGYGDCPPTAAFGPNTPYTYIEVRNPHPRSMKVGIYNKKAEGGSIIDTLIAVYPGTTIPTTTAARKQCMGTVGNYGDSDITGNTAFASLTGSSGVVVAANSSLQVYIAANEAYDSTTPSMTTGPVELAVKLEAVGP